MKDLLVSKTMNKGTLFYRVYYFTDTYNLWIQNLSCKSLPFIKATVRTGALLYRILIISVTLKESNVKVKGVLLIPLRVGAFLGICCGSKFFLVWKYSIQINFYFPLSKIMVMNLRPKKIKINLVWKILKPIKELNHNIYIGINKMR